MAPATVITVGHFIENIKMHHIGEKNLQETSKRKGKDNTKNLCIVVSYILA